MWWVSLWEWGLWSHIRAPPSGSGALPLRPCPGDMPLVAAQALGRAVWAQLLWAGSAVSLCSSPQRLELGGDASEWGVFLGSQGRS